MILCRKETEKKALSKLGVGKFYPWQEKVMPEVYSMNDIFLSVPTSGGKSLTYQLPAIPETGQATTLVIVPNRSLQLDQVAQLTAHGIKAVYLNSDLSKQDREKILANLPEYPLVYVTPEQLLSMDLKEALKNCRVARVVIDEAHMLPQAAPGFRKAYGKIGQFIRGLPSPPQISACTATALPKDRKAIIESLGMDHPKLFLFPLRRDNLRLFVKKVSVPSRCKNKKATLEENLFHAVEAALLEWDKKGAGSVVIYCPTVKRVKDLKKWLNGRGWKAAAYTGKMPQKKRLEAQERFRDGSKKIIVATNAFGLGINKPDIRLIIHAGLPLTLSGYTQEIGRAGRDGKKAKCILFYSDTDFQRNERILKQSGNKKAIRHGLKGLKALKEMLESSKCLWSKIEKYYGQQDSGPCGHCCHCKGREARK